MKKVIVALLAGAVMLWCAQASATVVQGTPAPLNPAPDTELSLPSGLRSIEAQAFFCNTAIEGALVIPDGVEEIGSEAFSGCINVTELHLPKSVRFIGSRAFAGTGLTGDVVIRHGVSVAADAFAECDVQVYHELPEEYFRHIPLETGTYIYGYAGPQDVQHMVVPRELSGVPVIGLTSEALACLPNITGRLILPDTVMYIQDGAFRDSGFTGPLPWPKLLKEIGPSAYYRCYGFTGDLVIPEGVAVAEWAFAYCGNLNRLKIPQSWTEIPSYAFCGCYELSGELQLPPGLKSIGDYAFFKTGFSGELALPQTVEHIGFAAFNQCHGFSGELNLPARLATIGGYAFEDCDGFSGNLVLPQGVQSVGEGAFAHCTGLGGEPVIPKTVRSIGPHAFEGSMGLTGTHFLDAGSSACSADVGSNLEIYVDMPLESLTWTIQNGGAVITGYKGPAVCDKELVLPRTLDGVPVTAVGDSAFYGCSQISGRLYLPDTIVSIGRNAFGSCAQLTGSLKLPAALSSVGSGAFYSCTGFTGDLFIPDSVTNVGSKAFAFLKRVTGSLHLSAGLTQIEAMAFQEGGFSGDLVIPDGVTAIHDRAFSQCQGMTGSLVLPKGLQSIGACAFSGNRFTGTLVLPQGLLCVGDSAFAFSQHFSGLVLPEGLTRIDAGAFAESSFGGELTLPSTLLQIGDYAFSPGAYVGKLVLPEGLQTIGEGAFMYCPGFTGALTIPSSVKKISSKAFYECTGLDGSLYLQEGLQIIGSGAFANCSSLSGWLTVPSTVTFIDSRAFEGCSGLRTRVEANGSLEMAADAFLGVESNFTVLYMEAQREMKASAEATLLAKMESMLKPDQLFSIMVDESTSSYERLYQAMVAVVFGNASSVVMPEVKSEYLFKQAVSAAATNQSVSVYNKEYFGDAMNLINGGNSAGSDVYLQALCQHLGNTDLAQQLNELNFDDVIGLFREGKMSSGMVETYLAKNHFAAPAIAKVTGGMQHLQKFDKAAKYIKTAGLAVNHFKDDIAAALNQAELLSALDKSALAETARVFLSSSDSQLQYVGSQLNKMAKATDYDACLALVFAGDLAHVGIDLMADQLIDMAGGSWASSLSLGSAIVGSLTGVGDNYRLINELNYSSDAARASYAVFQNDLASYRAGHSGRAFTNAYWSYCTYAETAARSLDDFVKIYDHVNSYALGKTFLDEEMHRIAEYARYQAASMRKFAASARALYENLWVTFDPDGFRAAVNAINSTDYGSPYQ